jgi:alkylation response protein AidB-like acyl-CoA dehydrogenase
LDLLLSEQQSLFAETAARLAADHGGPKRRRELRTAGGEIDAEAWRAVIDAEWLATVIAEAHGGQGLGAFDLALALEQAGRALMLVPLAEAGAVAWVLSRATAGAPALADLLRGSRLIVPAAATESWRHGDCPPGLDYDGKDSILRGSIPFVAFADAADAFLVAADAGSEPVLALVPRTDIGVSSERNVDGSAASTLNFADVHVAPEQMIATGARARHLISQLQQLLMLGAAAELVGLAAAALAVTLEHIKLRQQFGKPIGSFQVLQHRAVDGFIDIELDRSLIYRVLAAFDAGEHHPAMVAAAKARASRSALHVVRAALQMHGAIGYTEEHDIGLYYKCAMVLAARYGGELAQTGRFADLTLEHDPEKWMPVFGKDHAPPIG